MLEIISVNVRGLNSDEKRVRLYTWINDIKADVIFYKKHTILKKIYLNMTQDGPVNQSIVLVTRLLAEA